MSFWDNVKKMAQPYADDDYEDDEYDDEYDDGYEEPEERPRRASSHRSAPASEPASASAPEQDPEEGFNFNSFTGASSATASAPAPTLGFSGRTTTSGSSKSISNNRKVMVYRPSKFEDTSTMGDDLCANRAVVLNLENVDKALSRRSVDFLSGCVYALGGEVKKIAENAYMFAPNKGEIEGDLTLVAEDYV